MDAQTNRQRLLEAGFTEQPAAVIVDMFERMTERLVTREYLDRRLAEAVQPLVTLEYLNGRLLELTAHVDAVLDYGLRRQKRDILGWMVAAVAPLYVIVIYTAFKIGA
jgi:hypothetical protein